MKFTSSILLISAAIAAVVSAAPLPSDTIDVTLENSKVADLDVLGGYLSGLKARNDRLADLTICYVISRLSRSPTSGKKNLPKEKAALTLIVKTKIDKAKKGYSSESLAPIIKAIVTSDASLDIPWSKKDEAEKKGVELDAKVTDIVLNLLEQAIGAELLSKDCTEKMTNNEIAPAETPEGPFVGESVPPMPQTPAPVPEAPAPIPETPAPVKEAPSPIPETTTTTESSEDKGAPCSVDPKYVCKSGCKDTQAEAVLNLRINLEKQLGERLEQLRDKKVCADIAKGRSGLLGNVLGLLDSLLVDANVNV
ncbi:hypothetical protein BGX34_006735 [Mortierella sp. NVP85]|nr:hypothetical protein BGX34_006735 [Mortierella sp. NVP85]